MRAFAPTNILPRISGSPQERTDVTERVQATAQCRPLVPALQASLSDPPRRMIPFAAQQLQFLLFFLGETDLVSLQAHPAGSRPHPSKLIARLVALVRGSEPSEGILGDPDRSKLFARTTGTASYQRLDHDGAL